MERLRSLIAHYLSGDISENQTIQYQENNLPAPLYLLELTEGISELLPEDTQLAYPLAKMQEFILLKT